MPGTATAPTGAGRATDSGPGSVASTGFDRARGDAGAAGRSRQRRPARSPSKWSWHHGRRDPRQRAARHAVRGARPAPRPHDLGLCHGASALPARGACKQPERCKPRRPLTVAMAERGRPCHYSAEVTPSEPGTGGTGPAGAVIRGFAVGRIGGVPIVIAPSWVVSVAVIAALGVPVVSQVVPGTSTGLAVVVSVMLGLALGASVLAHEFGHCLAARALGMTVISVRLYLLGGVSELARVPRSPREEAIIAAAGPAVSGALAGVFALLVKLTGHRVGELAAGVADGVVQPGGRRLQSAARAAVGRRAGPSRRGVAGVGQPPGRHHRRGGRRLPDRGAAGRLGRGPGDQQRRRGPAAGGDRRGHRAVRRGRGRGGGPAAATDRLAAGHDAGVAGPAGRGVAHRNPGGDRTGDRRPAGGHSHRGRRRRAGTAGRRGGPRIGGSGPARPRVTGRQGPAARGDPAR